MTETIRFRPHHFLCALGYEGKGYSDAFTANMSAIVIERLRGPGGGRTRIKVTNRADSICGPCPHKRAFSCAEAPKINVLDRNHAAALDLKPGDILTWDEAKSRILDKVPPGSLTALCSNCQWLEYGMGETALRKLHEGGRG